MAAFSPHTEFLTLGEDLSGYLAKPHGVPGIGVVVLMEAFGLNAFVKGVCERFARAGYMALAPDIYHGDRFEYAGPRLVLGDELRSRLRFTAVTEKQGRSGSLALLRSRAQAA